MKRTLFIIAFLMSLLSENYAQIVFEEGYFINENDNRVECLIKNAEWKNNPTGFEYRLSPDADILKATIETVKEFGIGKECRYIRATVQIDRSGNQIYNMSDKRNPVFQEEVLFLKLLLEGTASLFYYESGDIKRFFYKMKDSQLTQLVYKQYLIDGIIMQNNFFRQQLINDFSCQHFTNKDFISVDYNNNELVKFFTKYHECINSDYIGYSAKREHDLFNLSIRPGLNLSSYSIENSMSSSLKTAFENKAGFRMGFEVEFILPFNKGKWGIVIEPVYQHFNAKKTYYYENVVGKLLTAEIDYHSVEVAGGIRHYFFLGEKFSIFLNASYVYDNCINSTMRYVREDGIIHYDLDLKSTGNAAMGMGFKFMKKFSMEFRYQTARSLSKDYVFFSDKYTTMSFIAGYSLF